MAPPRDTYFVLLSLIIFCRPDSCQNGQLRVIILDVRHTMSALGRSSFFLSPASLPAHPLISGNRRIDLWPPPPPQSDRRPAGDYVVNNIDMLALCWSLSLDGPVGQHPYLHIDSHMHTRTRVRGSLRLFSPLVWLWVFLVQVLERGWWGRRPVRKSVHRSAMKIQSNREN